MKDRIGAQLVSLAEPIIPLNLSEAETGAYPYAVYDYTPEYQRNKDGVYKISSEVTLNVYSQEGDQAQSLLEDLLDTLELGFKASDEFTYRLTETSLTCSEGVWNAEAYMTINQYNK